MRVNPKFANMQYLYANGDISTTLPEGTYSNLAATKYVKDNDKNKDGNLSSDEVTLSQEAFDKLDADKNGKISLKEMKAGLKGQDAAIQAYYQKKKGASSASDATSSLIEGKDDASATDTTYAAKAAASYLDSLDADGDGSLSSAEAALAADTFSTLDTNHDGQLSQAEVQAVLKSKENAFGVYYRNNVSSRTINGLTSSLLKTI